jgi:hypothetical protein
MHIPIQMKLTSENIANDPLAIARTYRRGIQTGLWKSLREAAAIFQQAGLPIFQTPLTNAVRVSAYPNTILQLFDRIPLSNVGVLALIAAEKEIGVSALAERCAQIDQAMFAMERELLAAIANDEMSLDTETRPGSQKTRLKPARLPPLQLAKTFLEGIVAGKWSTCRDAGAVLKRTHTDVALAVQIWELPSEVLALFNVSEVTAKIGRELISLKKALGSDALIRMASEIANEGKRRPLDEVIGSLRERGSIGSPNMRAPLLIAKEYENGKVLGRWRSHTAAEAVLGMKKDTMGVAIRISKLPAEVLKLFDTEQFRFFDGQKLLKLQNKLGLQQLIQNASAVSSMKPVPRKIEIFELLAGRKQGSRVAPGEVNVEFRMISKGGVSHIRITCPEIDVLSGRLDEIKAWCEYLLAEKSPVPKKKVVG